jgi:hypothetical protein
MGGVINVITKSPDTQQLDIDAGGRRHLCYLQDQRLWRPYLTGYGRGLDTPLPLTSDRRPNAPPQSDRRCPTIRLSGQGSSFAALLRWWLK